MKANLGAQVSANGEQFILVDESGLPIRGEWLTALMVNSIFTAYPRSIVVVPVEASSAVEQIARRHDGRVIRTKSNPTALMEAAQANPNVSLGGSGDTGFIFEGIKDIDKVCSFLKLEKKGLSIKARNRIKIQYPIEKRKEEFKNSLTEINSNE